MSYDIYVTRGSIEGTTIPPIFIEKIREENNGDTIIYRDMDIRVDDISVREKKHTPTVPIGNEERMTKEKFDDDFEKFNGIDHVFKKR